MKTAPRRARIEMFPKLIGKGLLLIISGPSGSGKTTLCERMVETFEPQLQRAVTATTREPRGQEKDGQDYHFFSLAEFERRRDAGEFYEWAQVHGNYYGTLKSEVRDKLEAGTDLILNIDVQGAASFRKVVEEDKELAESLLTVFVTPPDVKELRNRLKLRATDPPEVIEERLKNAHGEIRHWGHYHFCILSGSREEDFSKLKSIYIAERIRVHRMSAAES